MKKKKIISILLGCLIFSNSLISVPTFASTDIFDEPIENDEKIIYNLEDINDLHYEEGSREEALLNYLKENPEQAPYFMSDNDLAQYNAYKNFMESSEFHEMSYDERENIEELLAEKESIILRQDYTFTTDSIVPMFTLPNIDDFKRYSKQRARDVIIAAAYYLSSRSDTKLTGLLLANSLQDNPSTLYYDNNSYAANLINYNSSEFQTLKQNFNPTSQNRIDTSIAFKSNRDLYLGIHKADISMKKTSLRDIKCYVHDLYNFEYWKWKQYSNTTWNGIKDTSIDNFIIFVNNTASYLEDNGIINAYHIKINFTTRR